MSEQLVTYELDGEVAIIGLNRPEKRNALSPELQSQLRDAVNRAGDEAKCGILFGHGGNFCAGLDLAWAAESWKGGRSQRLPFNYNRNLHQEVIARGNIPFIAALHGATLGVRIARLLGFSCMQDMMLTGRVLKPDEAERKGLVQYLVPKGQSLAKAKELALRICKNAPLSNFAITNSLPRLQDMGYDDGLYFERMVGEYTRSPESIERLKQFLDKTAPRLKMPD